MADDVDEVCKVMKPGSQEFIMLEKINQDELATVRTGFRYCQGVGVNNEEQAIAMMLRNAETNPPERVVFKGKPTEVYLHKLTLKDSIWLMWENKCKTGPHATEGSNSEEVKASESAQQVALQRKHTHRNRAAETTFYAKYTFVVSNMELVNADPDSEGK